MCEVLQIMIKMLLGKTIKKKTGSNQLFQHGLIKQRIFYVRAIALNTNQPLYLELNMKWKQKQNEEKYVKVKRKKNVKRNFKNDQVRKQKNH